MTQIIATIGPASLNKQTLSFFASHSVAIARMNFSHNTVQWHEESALLARQCGLDLLFDLQGPKIRLEEVQEIVEVKTGEIIEVETIKANQSYPYKRNERLVFPYKFPVHKFVQNGHQILVDDGKMQWIVTEVKEDSVICRVANGGPVKSRKGMNMPDSSLEVSFLQDRDVMFLTELLPKLMPEYVAASFVKTKSDLDYLNGVISSILKENNIADYFPKIVAKVEMKEAVTDQNLPEIVAASDVVMIARGDLALETLPAHINVPFLQEKIKQECRKQGKPFVVATQILESMSDVPVATRAEVSDLYRAVILDDADFVMCSGETAAGKYPLNCIQLMHDMIVKSPSYIAAEQKKASQTQTI